MVTLEEAFEKIKIFCNKYDISEELHYKLNLVVEELVVNILSYTDAREYNLNLAYKNSSLHIVIDYKGENFNPKKFIKEDKCLEDMDYGGLGLLLVNSLSKKVEYSYSECKNIVKIEL